MPAVRVIHWKEPEAKPLIEACRAAGCDVEYLAGDGGALCRAIRSNPPAIVVIDLSCRPSHGREVAVWLRNTKSMRGIPIVFCEGEESKVAVVRQFLPDAEYCGMAKVTSTVKRVMKSSVRRDPRVPAAMMERAREKSACEKLGVTKGATVAVIEPPGDFPELLGPIPESVEFQEDDAPLTLWFVHDREGLMNSLREMRSAAARTKLWLLWRKGSSGGGLTQNALRDSAREVGLVDYKICSVNVLWSGMLFARKKA
jgi:CheY-like chemotaxis protein